MRRSPLVVALVLASILTSSLAAKQNEHDSREAALATLDLQQQDFGR